MGSKNNRKKLDNILLKTSQYYQISDRSNLIRIALGAQTSMEQAIAQASDQSKAPDGLDKLIKDLIQGTDGSIPMLDFEVTKIEDGEEKKEERNGFITNLHASLKSNSGATGPSGGVYDNLKDGKIVSLTGNWDSMAGCKASSDEMPELFSKFNLFDIIYPPKSIESLLLPGPQESMGELFNRESWLPKKQTRKTPSITKVEMKDDWTCRSHQDIQLVSIFSNGIPSTELAQCVPYLDVQIIDTVSPSRVAFGDKFRSGPAISAVKFIKGFGDLDETSADLLAATPKEILDASIENEPQRPASAGMEIFTMPQTYTGPNQQYVDLNDGAIKVPEGRPNPILKPFQPLLTITGFKYSVESTNTVMSTLRGTLSVVLHDRSRMHEVAPLMRPDKSAGLELLVEWGWSHPGKDSLFSELLNCCRTKRKFIVSTSTYQFQSDGSVQITLNMFAKGNQTVALDLVANDGAADIVATMQKEADDLSALIKSTSDAGEGSAKQQSKMIFGSEAMGRFSSVGGMLTIPSKELDELEKSLEKAQETKDKQAKSQAYEEHREHVLNCIKKVRSYREQQKKAYKIKDYFFDTSSSALNTTTGKPDIADDPWRKNWSKVEPIFYNTTGKAAGQEGDDDNLDGSGNLPEACDFNNQDYISFAKLISVYVLPALKDKGAWDDIQFYYYPANEASFGYSKFDTLASIPVHKERWKERWKVFRDTVPNPSLLQFISLTTAFLEEDKAGGGFGLGAAFVAKKNEKSGVSESRRAPDDQSFSYGRRLAEASKHIYGCIKKFKQPKIRLDVETIPFDGDSSKSILRMHFYDQAKDSYSSYTEYLRQNSNKAIGIISQQLKIEPVTSTEKEVVQQFDKLVDLGFLEKVEVKAPKVEGENSKEKAASQKNADYLTQINYYRTMKSPMQMKYFLSKNMPMLKYGTEYSIMTNVAVSAQPDGALSMIQLKRRIKGGGKEAAGKESDSFPLQLFSTQLTVETIGCPFFRHGQQFFFDFQTNTDIDNVYIITGIDHDISPGKFSTKLRLARTDRFGFFETLEQKLTEIQVAITAELDAPGTAPPP